ncbi:MAG: hypothetical protein QMD53_05820 [Actinomycetota bacterium]|nr:hypothetical protein [Actinomycetota bacterium]
MRRRRHFPFVRLVSLIIFFSLTLTSAALALSFEGEEAVLIGADEVIEDDLYVGAASFTLDGTVKGDLIVFAQFININGNVEGDLVAAGQIISINGNVADDVRIAGQVLTIGDGAAFGGDLMAAGLSIESKSGTSVGGDFAFAGAQALVNGNVAQDMLLAVGGLKLGGQVGGDVKAMIGEADEGGSPFTQSNPPVPPVPFGLTITQGASVAGNLVYTSESEFEIPAGVVAGEITHKLPPVSVDAAKEISPTAKLFGRFSPYVKRFVSLAIIALLMAWLFFEKTKGAADTILAKPWPALGFGLLSVAAFFVWLIAVMIVMITLASILGLIGLGGLAAAVVFAGLFAIGLSIFFFVLLLVYVVKIFICLIVGRFILLKASPQTAAGKVWPILIGVPAYVAITSIPVLGGFLNFIAVVTGLGAVWLMVTSHLQGRKEAKKESRPKVEAAPQA